MQQVCSVRRQAGVKIYSSQFIIHSHCAAFLPRCSMQPVLPIAKVSVCLSVTAWIVTKRKHLAKKVQLENVSTANALQLEAARRRAVPIRFYTSPVASLKSLSLSVAVLERIYCLYVTLRCDLELWPRDLDLWPLTLNICSLPAVP